MEKYLAYALYIFLLKIMGEISDFSAFSKPKQLFAYFGLDPAVKQSGKFEGTKVQIVQTRLCNSQKSDSYTDIAKY